MEANFFISFPELKTARLSLRQLREEDAEALLPIAFTSGVAAQSLEDALVVVRRQQQNYENQNSLGWAIWLEGVLVGTVGFYRGFQSNFGEVGYIMNPDFRGQGIMKEAVAEVVRFGLNEFGLDGIYAYTAEDNTPSRKLLEHNSFEETNDRVEKLIKYRLVKEGK